MVQRLATASSKSKKVPVGSGLAASYSTRRFPSTISASGAVLETSRGVDRPNSRFRPR